MIAKVNGIADSKGLLGQLPTLKTEVPEFIYMATENARCKNVELFIEVGDHVNCCQKIGVRHGPFFDQPIHSTVSGTYVGKEKHYHRSGKIVEFIKIQNDFKDTMDPSVKERSDEEIEKLTREEITEIIKETAMVGLGGSSFPTYIKFQTKEPIKMILINGIECEPYITADHRLMLEEMENVIKGIQILQHAFGVKDARICIKQKYHDLHNAYSLYLKRFPESGITVSLVDNVYPAGWEIAMIKKATGIDVARGALPSKYGIINFNVSTVWGVYEAVKYNRPVMDRRISITGDGIKYPSNFLVRIGTPIRPLIEKCGGYSDPDKNKIFILGGPMMGASEPSDDCIVTKTVTSVIVLNEENVVEEPCIRCGSCVYSCPTGLQPVTIMNAVKAMNKEMVKALNPLNCIECGLCTYACTSKIRVTDYVRRAKVIAKLP